MDIYKRLLIYLRPYRMRMVWAALFMLLSSAMISAQTYLVKPVIDKVIIGRDWELGRWVPLALIIVSILKGITSGTPVTTSWDTSGRRSWAFININSLPMIVDLTVAEKIGMYTGLYYLFSTLSAIVGPISNGVAIEVFDNYNIIMALAPILFSIAFILMLFVRRGEAPAEQRGLSPAGHEAKP